MRARPPPPTLAGGVRCVARKLKPRRGGCMPQHCSSCKPMSVTALPEEVRFDEGEPVLPVTSDDYSDFIECRARIRGALAGTCDLGEALLEMELVCPEAASWWSRRLESVNRAASQEECQPPACRYVQWCLRLAVALGFAYHYTNVNPGTESHASVAASTPPPRKV